MIDFLKKYGINSRTILILNSKHHNCMLYNLSCNEYEIEKAINYFTKIGIKCIDELLINNVNLFLNSYADVMKKFSKYNIDELVNSINDNPDNIRYFI